MTVISRAPLNHQQIYFVGGGVYCLTLYVHLFVRSRHFDFFVHSHLQPLILVTIVFGTICFNVNVKVGTCYVPTLTLTLKMI